MPDCLIALEARLLKSAEIPVEPGCIVKIQRNHKTLFAVKSSLKKLAGSNVDLPRYSAWRVKPRTEKSSDSRWVKQDMVLGSSWWMAFIYISGIPGGMYGGVPRALLTSVPSSLRKTLG